MRLGRSLFLIALLAGCAAPRSSAPGSTASPGPPSRSASPSEPVAQSALDLLDCDGPASPMGGSAGDFGPAGAGATPDEAFASFLESMLFGIPLDGYEKLGENATRAVYTYGVNGSTKVVIVISGRFSEHVGDAFTIDELRTCDPSEYGQSVDLGPGRRVWTHAATGAILTDIAGPGHCGWESARMLHTTTPEGTVDRQYVRDPEGVFAGVPGLLAEYAEGIDLPADATFSGYRTADGQELWFVPDDRAAYVVTEDGVERWPRADPPIGCA